MKRTIVTAAVAVALAAVSVPSFATLPTEATDAITLIGTDGLALQLAIWGPLATITVGFIIMKLFKRGGNKI